MGKGATYLWKQHVSVDEMRDKMNKIYIIFYSWAYTLGGAKNKSVKFYYVYSLSKAPHLAYSTW